MENMSWEIVEAVKGMYEDDEELIASCLHYLSKVTCDPKLELQCLEVCEDLGYYDYYYECSDCYADCDYSENNFLATEFF